MVKPCLRTFCWCCGSLQIATLVIVILGLMYNTTVFICSTMSILVNIKFPNTVKEFDDELGLKDFKLFQVLHSQWVHIIFMCTSLISIVTNGMAIYGIFKRRHDVFLPWLIIEAMFAILAFSIVTLAIFTIIEDDSFKLGAVFFMIILPGAMGRPLLNTCCFCQSLRTGSIISGVLGILLAIASLIVMFLTRVEFRTIVLDWLPSNIVKIILAINLSMTILISLLLIVGVLKRNQYLMLPWVMLGIMLAVGLLVSVIYTAIVFLIDDYILTGVFWLVFGLISVAIFSYMWCVVYSYYAVLQEENSRGLYDKQPYRR